MCLNGLFGSGKRDSPGSLGDGAAHFERILFFRCIGRPCHWADFFFTKNVKLYLVG